MFLRLKELFPFKQFLFEGIPDLKSIGSIDPLHVKRVSLDQSGSGPIAVRLKIQDAEIAGLSGISIKDMG